MDLEPQNLDFEWILDESANRACNSALRRRAKKWSPGRGVRQLSPNLARLRFASDLFSPVLARPRQAS
ncbi:hypothetical protein A2U01_0049840, partial [Trifolium medium]|nr:hypothetical protein [Trifolium medium]